ncbi:zinc ABC transporter ATP-binding protein AztA [Spirillospora sp. NPDC029432]|uniref:zinc ABC transporter ATP-binding protein AztA n=1 Tax=Spirillospora sp. NPDC029432 TaxID=3154599 RepID=UPI00345333C9
MDGTAIRLDGVRAGYGSTTVLHGITAAVPRARVTALTGHNGSGKSTLLGVLAGTLAPSAGTVERGHARPPAMVFQSAPAPAALPMTVREAVAMGRWALRGPWRRLTRADRAAVDACMERAGVAGLGRTQLARLSGGQYRRVLLAQGLAQESDLLLLDEPAAGLDHGAREDVLEAFGELAASGVTVVHATHETDAAGHADHRLHLRDGRLAPSASAAR